MQLKPYGFFLIALINTFNFTSFSFAMQEDQANKLIKITSLSSLKEHVQELLNSGYETNDILVSFDFDGTLSHRKEDQGNRKSGELLQYLEIKGISYFVNTAAKSGTGEIWKSFIEDKLFGYTPKIQDIWTPKQEGEKSCPYYLSNDVEKKIPFYKASQFKIEGTLFYHCGIAFSAYYDKDKVINYVVSLMPIKPKTIIHVDDSALMALVVYQMSNYKKSEIYQVISMYFPPLEKPKSMNEPYQEEAEKQIDTILNKGPG